MSQHQEQSWLRLEGKVNDALLRSLQGGGASEWNGPHLVMPDEIAQYLSEQVSGSPWTDHLVLVAGALTARGMSINTVFSILWSLHPRFKALFLTLGLQRMDQWNAQHILAYLKGKLLPDDPQSMRLTFWQRYSSASRNVRLWLATMPREQRHIYQEFALPVVDIINPYMLIKNYEVLRRHQQLLDEQIHHTTANFAALRAAAHLRYNQIVRLHRAYLDALRRVQDTPSAVPLAFSYEDVIDTTLQCLHLCLWDRHSFVLAHTEAYSKATVRQAQKRQEEPLDEPSRLLLELRRIVPEKNEVIPVELWFEELLRRDVLGAAATWGAQSVLTAKQDWLRSRGYRKEQNEARVAPFRSDVPGLLHWPSHANIPQFVSKAQQLAHGLLIPLSSLYAAALLGLLALDLLTTTGIPLEEMRYLRLDGEGIVGLMISQSVASADQAPTIRYVARITTPHAKAQQSRTYFIGKETRRLMMLVAKMLADHYNLDIADTLPQVPPSSSTSLARDSSEAPYLFQYNHRHLTTQTILSCIRFLVHELEYRDHNGERVRLTPAILDAILARAQPAKPSELDVIGAWVEQQPSRPDVVQQPQELQMRIDETELFFSQFALHIPIHEAVQSSSPELQQAYEDARRKAGIWSEVAGVIVVIRNAAASGLSVLAVSERSLTQLGGIRSNGIETGRVMRSILQYGKD